MFLPGVDLRLGAVDARSVAEHMRMPPHHLAADGSHHVAEIEQAAFLGHAGVEHHLEQQVAQLVLQAVPVLFLDGAGDFVGFLDGVGRDGGEGLLDIPWAAALGRCATRA